MLPSLPVLEKRAEDVARANLRDYDAARASFSWETARRDLDGLPSGGLNIAHEAVDRHAAGPRGSRVAIRWLGRSGTTWIAAQNAARAPGERLLAAVLFVKGVALALREVPELNSVWEEGRGVPPRASSRCSA